MFEKRRLAGAVRANEAVNLAHGCPERHAIEGGLASERSREVIDVDD
jgi:hypothetical protein